MLDLVFVGVRAVANVAFFAVYFVWSKQARAFIDVVPFLFGALFFPTALPGEPAVWAAFGVSLLLAAGTFGICGLTTHGIVGTHFVAHAVEHGKI